MNVDDVLRKVAELDECKARRADLEVELAELEERVSRVRRVLMVLDQLERRLVPTRRTHTEDGTPLGREAIRQIVSERPGVWTLVELRAELQARGAFSSAKATDVAVGRLVRSGEARHVGRGTYEFQTVRPNTQPGEETP